MSAPDMVWSKPLDLGSPSWERPAWLPADALLRHVSGRTARASSWAFGPGSVFSLALVLVPPFIPPSTDRNIHGEPIVDVPLTPYADADADAAPAIVQSVDAQTFTAEEAAALPPFDDAPSK